MNETRRALLAELASGPVSGPALAERLDVSRAAVWKQVEALRDEGFVVESTDAGYVVSEVPEFGAGAVEYGLDTGYRIEYHDSVGSTNDRGRELAKAGERDIVILADEQTGSRGRLRRAWSAPSGGVWLSIVFQPDCPPAHAPVYTLAAAVATTRAAREAGVDASIKWPNDVLVVSTDTPDGGTDRGGRKLAGILTEMEGEANRVSWVLVGIGVNANIDASELPAGATSIRDEAGDVERRLFVQRLLEVFDDLRDDPDAILDAWREYADTLGRRVRIETPTETIEGEAVDVEFPGALVVRTSEGDRVVHTGDCEHLRPV
ncbi:biotin--[acetyl-CoA-carboxylase] ligase [Salinigranum rubrum]|uniref:Biotin--[acetyl-CoA-carboxylase] ligase n=1 Tax=Salinigranum rubrum TaxID=755307 RepID=A0A2I8VJY6_9EURY|nr:biotin--[acetyl-CoA-carboxylase] ligase [Salinigranum rubrum]AUV82237.1 biotin--[acetyl-CoA-carboxylase] ligase [Salinigranum rubrum]